MVSVPLQVAASPAAVLLFPAGVVAGGVATLAMDAVMARIDAGRLPPRIASAVLTGRPPDEAPERLASAVHYVAGLLTGALFAWLLLAAAAVVGPGAPAGAVAAAACYPLMVGFFGLVVLPRSRGLARDRVRAIRRAWVIEAAAYLLVLAPLVTAVAAAL